MKICGIILKIHTKRCKVNIASLQINNYRNLDGLFIEFNEDINIIVGENNVGKTNLLELINNISLGKRFEESDFFDTSKSIEILLKISLSELELGIFDLLCDEDNEKNLTVIIRQKTIDENLECIHNQTGKQINSSKLRLLNSYYYTSTRIPKQELVFNKRTGAAKFLTFLLAKYKRDNHIDENTLVNKDVLSSLTQNLTETINKISTLESKGLKISSEQESLNILSSLIYFADSNSIKLAESGDGIQYVLMFYISLLENVMNISDKENRIILNDTKKSCSLIQMFDEPEVHLNPFLQKSLLAYLLDIIDRKDDKFKELVKSTFDIDDVKIQAIISTHSESMICNDYTKIIRIYNDNGKIKAICGKNIVLNPSSAKIISQQFKYIKEALFAKKVFVVEGYSELGAMPIFADKARLNLDKNNISLINAMSADSVRPLMDLLSGFILPSVGIRDSDNIVSTVDKLFCTTKQDFEEEIICKAIDCGKYHVLIKIIEAYDEQKQNRLLQKESINRRIKKYNISINDFLIDAMIKNIDVSNKNATLAVMLTWFTINKNANLGKLIAEKLSIDMIPQCYIDAINMLRTL